MEVSGGFLFLAALLYYLDTSGLLFWSALSCACHELGHYLLIRMCGGEISALRLSCVGAELELSPRKPMSPLEQLATALSGPAVNLLLAAGAARLARRWGWKLYLFSGINLGLAVFNLLPAAQLDGGQVLYSVLTLFWPEERAERVVQISSLAISAALVLGGWVLLLEGRASITLLITALWLFAASLPGTEKKLVFS